MEDNIFYIYVFLNPLKKGSYEYGELTFDYEPFYLGYSNKKTYYKREDVHIRYALNGKDVCNNKYKENIIKQIYSNNLEPIIINPFINLSKEEAIKKEIFWIKKIGCKMDNSGPLTNITKGGDGGDTFTNNPRKEEIREKHRQNALGERNHMYGRPLEKNPSHLSKLSGKHWNLNRKASNELREKFSKMRKGANSTTAIKIEVFDTILNENKIYGCIKDFAQVLKEKTKIYTHLKKEKHENILF